MGEKTFDASRYLTKLEGKDYLEVKWRLLWLRTEHPDAIIATELVKHEGGMAIFKAKITLPEGSEATGWGSETINDFGDYIEKAETKAIGRACAALGYGTQFCEDFDFKMVDTPVEQPSTKPPPAPCRATQAQVKALYAIARNQYGLSEEELNKRSGQTYGCLPAELTKQKASEFIAKLRASAKAR